MSLPSWRRVLHVVTFLLLLAIVIPFVIYAVPATVGADGSYVVLSGSMEPAIEVGDVVIVDEVDPATIEEGDVITYVRAGEETPTTHRVIGVEEGDGELAFQTMGDANEDPDASPVPAEQVNGKVIFAIPYIGYVVEFANTPYGFAALVAVPFALLVVTELYSFFKGARRNEPSGKADEESVGISADAAGEPADAPDPDPASAEPAETRTSEEPQGGDGDGTIALTRTDLRLSLLLLVGTTIYAGWVVTLIQEPWSFAAAFASGITLVLVAGMYYLAGAGGTAGAGAAEPPEEGTAGGGSGNRTAGDASSVSDASASTSTEPAPPPAANGNRVPPDRDVIATDGDPGPTTAGETPASGDAFEFSDPEREAGPDAPSPESATNRDADPNDRRSNGENDGN